MIHCKLFAWHLVCSLRLKMKCLFSDGKSISFSHSHSTFFCCLQINYFIFCWFGSCVHKLHLFCCIFPITDIKSKRNRLALEKGEIYFAYYAKSKENQKLLYHIAGASTVWDNKSVFSFNVITYLFTPRICCY